MTPFLSSLLSFYFLQRRLGTPAAMRKKTQTRKIAATMRNHLRLKMVAQKAQNRNLLLREVLARATKTVLALPMGIPKGAAPKVTPNLTL